MEAASVNIHADLIRKCRDNDPSAQYELYRLYSRAMYNTALRIVGSREDAEDVLQDAFVSAFRYMEHYRGDAAFGAWLKKIVVNKAITFLKKTKKNLMLIEEAEDGRQAYEQTTDEPDLAYTVEEIKKRVSELPSGFRSVLTLYLFEGYDHKEIAEIMNITESTSKTQYKRAREKLKSMLTKAYKYG